jgi:hypothetical protein
MKPTSERFLLDKQARWIWGSDQEEEDCYYEFKGAFHSHDKSVRLYLSAETSYALYFNGVFIPSSQFISFEEYPVYQTLTLKSVPGVNYFRLLVYHCGVKGFSTLVGGKAGVWYSFWQKGKEIAFSSRETRSRKSLTYISGQLNMVSPQLGYSYAYDSTQEDETLGFHDSFEVEKPLAFTPRDNKEPAFYGRSKSVVTPLSPTLYQIDLLREEVGYLELDFESSSLQNIEIFYAEHLVNGRVNWMIDGRRFKIDYKAKIGHNAFLGPFLRLGARYLEVKSLSPLKIAYIGIQEVHYPFIHRAIPALPPLRRKIYEVARYTLECCYFNHYENSPWREQTLYTTDIRNAMLASYFAFNNPEAIRSSLSLIAKDQREDGLFRIATPSSLNLVIPSGCECYFASVWDYYEHTHDLSLLEEVEAKLNDVASGLLRMEKNGLLYNYKAKTYWNFYDWRSGLDGTWPTDCDFSLNASFVMAMSSLEKIEKALHHPFLFALEKERIMEAAHAAFYDQGSGLFYNDLTHQGFSQFANALAILSEIASPKERERIAKALKMPSEKIMTVSLGNSPYLYDALLKVSKKNAPYVLNAIDYAYGAMLQEGATTFYETENGWIDFMGAGSLCHGRSAMPIVYYSLLRGD